MKNFNLLILLSLMVLLNACGDDDESGDTLKPTAPSNLIASNITDTSLQLEWEPSVDNIKVAGYKIYEEISGDIISVGGASVSYSANNLIPATAYKYHVTAIDAVGNESAQSNTVEVATNEAPLEFLPLLSQMGVFSGDLSDLTPAANVQLYELNSTLFTDYAEKQRLVRLPNGQAMRYNDSDFLPIFPDNTLISKTFYYHLDNQNPSMGRQIIETRILLKISGSWQVGNYIWNANQSEAVYRETGSEIPISYIDDSGITQNINYMIPSKQDCFTCHNNSSTTFPIGMKLRSMNFTPSYTNQNQLEYFKSIGILEGLVSGGAVSILPDWTDDINFSLDQRARAYIDINCAHCHQPGGTVTNFDLDFRYETDYDNTGIYVNRGEIEERIQSNTPTYRMPQLGRTVVHAEAVTVLLEYLESLD